MDHAVTEVQQMVDFQAGIQVSSLGLLATDHNSPDHTITLKSFLLFSGVLYPFFLLVLKSNTAPQPGPYELLLRLSTFHFCRNGVTALTT